MRYARIDAIEYHLPHAVLSNDELSRQFGDWSADQILKKTGISERRIAADDETATDLAAKAAEKLLARRDTHGSDIDFLILCTQGPDYPLPTSACILQDRLGLPKSIGAIDVNQGCSGFVYSLAVAKGLIESSIADKVLIVTADTYTKYLSPTDKGVRTIFGDGAAATLVSVSSEPSPSGIPWIGAFDFGTDGSGASSLIVRAGGARTRSASEKPTLHMDGPAIFSFALKAVPESVSRTLTNAGVTLDDIDLCVFHQASLYMLETLRRKVGVPVDRFVIDLQDKGNTVSSTIPIALSKIVGDGHAREGSRKVLVAGFGVGLSWSSTILVV